VIARRGGQWAALALVVGVAAALLPGPAASQTTDAVAIVVHPEATVEGLTFAQLRRIFLGDQQFWPDRTRITLLVRAPDAYERSVVLERIYDMSEEHFRRYWIAKIFRADVSSGPKIVYSNDMILELITALPGAIGFMRVSEVAGGVKVLPIDGKLPGESGYPLL